MFLCTTTTEMSEDKSQDNYCPLSSRCQNHLKTTGWRPIILIFTLRGKASLGCPPNSNSSIRYEQDLLHSSRLLRWARHHKKFENVIVDSNRRNPNVHPHSLDFKGSNASRFFFSSFSLLYAGPCGTSHAWTKLSDSVSWFLQGKVTREQPQRLLEPKRCLTVNDCRYLTSFI